MEKRSNLLLQVFAILVVCVFFLMKKHRIELPKEKETLAKDKGPTSEKTVNVSNKKTMVKNESAQKKSENYFCAPWIPAEKRKIVMHSFLNRFVTWEDHRKGVIKGGEPYWGASLYYILQSLGFNVSITDPGIRRLHPSGELLQQLDQGQIHRIVTDSSSGGQFDPSIWSMPEILCKVRMMVFWPGHKRKNNAFSVLPVRYDETSTTSAHFVPFFVHGVVTDPPITKMISRSRRAIFFFTRVTAQIVPEVLIALHNEGFELHFQCSIQVLSPQRHPDLNNIFGNFTFHGKYQTPSEFTKNILQRVAIVVGVGDPIDSPTPLEALYNGAAFLNPLYERNFDGFTRSAMHRPLANLGPPYVYNYNGTYFSSYQKEHVRELVVSILEAAKIASSKPFVSFTPADYRIDAVRAYVCSNIIEYDPCHINE
jgi:hypothetical protein